MTYYVDAKRWFGKHDPNGYVSPAQDKCEATLQAHNLEQQAKGLTDYANSQEQGIAAVWMLSAASKLIERAKELEKSQ